MGLLSRLFGSKPSFNDRVFVTHQGKAADLVRHVSTDVKSGNGVVVYHFDDTARWLRDAFQAAGMGFEDVRRPSASAVMDLPASVGAGSVPLVSSNELASAYELVRGEKPPIGRAPIRVHVAERFPTPERDDNVLAFHEVLPKGSEFIAYVSLDEPWLEAIVSDQVRSLMKELGLKDDECLTHSMISSSPTWASGRRRVQT